MIENSTQIIIHASAHVLTEEISKSGFALLCLMHSYLELDMFSSLIMQTESTLERG